MSRETAYRVLCGALGGLFLLAGLAMFYTFFRFHAPGMDPPLPTGPTGHYFVGFAGTSLLAWGGCLLEAARRPDAGRSVGTWSALALVLMACMRIAAWIVGDYYVWPGELLRFEAVAFLLLALGFVWLRPPARPVGAAS